MMGVQGNSPSRSEMSTDRFGRNDAGDQIMVAAAWFAFDLALPTEEQGRHHLASPDRDEVWARRLFERAVGGFYRVTLTAKGWSVRTGTKLHWQLDWESPGMSEVLPGMTTDIILDSPDRDRRIVIDTKFTSLLKPGHYKSRSISSGYLYQIYAYLKSQAGKGGLNEIAEGLMLHPSVGESIDLATSIQGQTIRFATVDLSKDSQTVRRQLLSAVESAPIQ
jgi:5-methylcytosine-specific restriction enzyme subunit McrC